MENPSESIWDKLNFDEFLTEPEKKIPILLVVLLTILNYFSISCLCICSLIWSIFNLVFWLFLVIFFLQLKTKYVGKEKVDEGLSTKGLNQMDKTLCVRGTRISYSMWEVKGIHIHLIIFFFFKKKIFY